MASDILLFIRAQRDSPPGLSCNTLTYHGQKGFYTNGLNYLMNIPCNVLFQNTLHTINTIKPGEGVLLINRISGGRHNSVSYCNASWTILHLLHSILYICCWDHVRSHFLAGVIIALPAGMVTAGIFSYCGDNVMYLCGLEVYQCLNHKHNAHTACYSSYARLQYLLKPQVCIAISAIWWIHTALEYKYKHLFCRVINTTRSANLFVLSEGHVFSLLKCWKNTSMQIWLKMNDCELSFHHFSYSPVTTCISRHLGWIHRCVNL